MFSKLYSNSFTFGNISPNIQLPNQVMIHDDNDNDSIDGNDNDNDSIDGDETIHEQEQEQELQIEECIDNKTNKLTINIEESEYLYSSILHYSVLLSSMLFCSAVHISSRRFQIASFNSQQRPDDDTDDDLL